MRRQAAGCGAAAVGIVLLALYVLIRTGERGTLRHPADAIVVLGAQVRPDGRPSAALRGRVRRAAALHHAGYAPCVALTGGIGDAPFAEAVVMQALAVALGVPEEATALEPAATRTVESARLVGAMARQRGWRSVILVSDPFHLRRAALLFGGQGLTVQTAATNDYYFSARSRRRYRLREMAGLAVQAINGEIPPRAWWGVTRRQR